MLLCLGIQGGTLRVCARRCYHVRRKRSGTQAVLHPEQESKILSCCLLLVVDTRRLPISTFKSLLTTFAKRKEDRVVRACSF